PPRFDYQGLRGLSNEVRQKLGEIRPLSIGQASRISGMTPAAISVLMVALERDRRASRLGIPGQFLPGKASDSSESSPSAENSLRSLK
ncbi:MAG TPA: hypothetical protein VN944_01130, partial [Nitrospiria bacterium]|nr:hypothetical protein [Nitrospiria bacterium]